jgi:predicted alpha/beta-hydrolase family hydrolase
MSKLHEFSDVAAEPAIRGFLHEPSQASGDGLAYGDGLVLTHGAGANCQSKLLIALAEEFANAGYVVLRCDLPFRQSRPHGPPFPAMAPRDREGLRRAVEVLRAKTPGRIFLGGHSYGGRQSSMLAAEQPQLVAGLLLLSYPLHPPRKPTELRTAHFPQLSTPTLFVHGGRDPFGSHDELKAAVELITAPHLLLEIEGAGHELLGKKTEDNLPSRIVQAFREFLQ